MGRNSPNALAAGAWPALAAGAWPNLQWLRLAHINIGNGVVALAAGAWPRLVWLEVCGLKACTAAIEALIAAAYWPELKKLDVRLNGISREDERRLHAAHPGLDLFPGQNFLL